MLPPVAPPRKPREERLRFIENLPGQVNWDALPPEERRTARTFALLSAYGFSRDELSKFYGVAPYVIGQRMSSLRKAIEAQVDGEHGPGDA